MGERPFCQDFLRFLRRWSQGLSCIDPILSNLSLADQTSDSIEPLNDAASLDCEVDTIRGRNMGVRKIYNHLRDE